MLVKHGLVISFLLIAMIATVVAKKLTVQAAIAGGILGFLIYLGAGYTGVAMLAAFFICGTVATSWQNKLKQQLKLEEKDKGRRTTGQVFANAGVAGVLGLLIFLYPQFKTIFILMMAASFASATADTLSSELGNVYGKKYYNILTLKKDSRGLDGVVSIEGTFIGIAGSLIIAIVYAVGFGWTINILWIVIAGTIGNISDSILGASLERSNYLSNNAVNLLNTFIGATAVLLLYLL